MEEIPDLILEDHYGKVFQKIHFFLGFLEMLAKKEASEVDEIDRFAFVDYFLFHHYFS